MVYTLLHKPTGYVQIQPGTVGLQVGDYPERIGDVRDSDAEDNIAGWNNLYAELTGIYYIWKHDNDELKGQHQYRRWLPLINGIPEGYRVRTMRPLSLQCTMGEQYCLFHSPKDLETVTKIISAAHPDYLDDWGKVLNGHTIYYSNGFLMHRKDYDAYCRFLFGIFELFRHVRGWEKPEDSTIEVENDIRNRLRNGVRGVKYQNQIFGFLSERLLTLWLTHNIPYDEIWTDPYLLRENSGI